MMTNKTEIISKKNGERIIQIALSNRQNNQLMWKPKNWHESWPDNWQDSHGK